MENLTDIINGFDISAEVNDIQPLGKGLINDTYLVKTEGDAPDYVLQRINDSIFKNPELLQRNIDAVTGHIRKKLEAAGEDDIDRKVLRFINAKDSDKSFLEKDGKFWRLSVFIPDTRTLDVIDEETSYCTGKAFGNFESMLSDIDVKLSETIPDFHNMELRMSQLIEAIDNDTFCRLDPPEEGDGRIVRVGDPNHRDEIYDMLENEIDEYSAVMCKAEQMFRDGILPKRICHCDPKVNNILFDKDGKILCVIDLDTVMPSFVFSDFGDFLRTAANTAAEDEPDTSKVSFRMDIFKSFARGYVESAKGFLTDIEKENLPFAACMFPFMQAVRFLTDYLNGDGYYKISYPDHNFVRAKSQMALFKSALSHLDEMSDFIKSL